MVLLHSSTERVSRGWSPDQNFTVSNPPLDGGVAVLEIAEAVRVLHMHF